MLEHGAGFRAAVDAHEIGGARLRVILHVIGLIEARRLELALHLPPVAQRDVPRVDAAVVRALHLDCDASISNAIWCTTNIAPKTVPAAKMPQTTMSQAIVDAQRRRLVPAPVLNREPLPPFEPPIGRSAIR